MAITRPLYLALDGNIYEVGDGDSIKGVANLDQDETVSGRYTFDNNVQFNGELVMYESSSPIQWRVRQSAATDLTFNINSTGDAEMRLSANGLDYTTAVLEVGGETVYTTGNLDTTDFAPAVHTHTNYIDRDGPGVIHADMVFDNNTGIKGTTTGASAQYLVRIGSDNKSHIGAVANPMQLNASATPVWYDGTSYRNLIHTGGGQKINGSAEIAGRTEIYNPTAAEAALVVHRRIDDPSNVPTLIVANDGEDTDVIAEFRSNTTGTSVDISDAANSSDAKVQIMGDGEIISKFLTLTSGGRFLSNGTYGLDLKNSDITGANGIVFADVTDTSTEGLVFPRGDITFDISNDGTYDTLRSVNGTLIYRVQGSDQAVVAVGNASADRFIFGSNAQGTTSVSDTTDGWNTVLKSGFYDGNNKPNAPGTDAWYWGIHSSHVNGNHYGWTLVGGNSANPDWYLRAVASGTWGDWHRILHEDISPTLTGTWSFDNDINVGGVSLADTYVPQNLYGGAYLGGNYLIFQRADDTNIDYIAYDDATNSFFFNSDTTLGNTSANAPVYAGEYHANSNAYTVGLGGDNTRYDAANLRVRDTGSGAVAPVLYADEGIATGYALEVRKHTAGAAFETIYRFGHDKNLELGGLSNIDTTSNGIRVSDPLVFENGHIIHENKEWGTESYLTVGEYVEIATLTPSGNSRNYWVQGEFIYGSSADTSSIIFHWTIRSNTLPSLGNRLEYFTLVDNHPGVRLAVWNDTVNGVIRLLAKKESGADIHNLSCYMRVHQRGDYNDFDFSDKTEYLAVDAGFTEVIHDPETLYHTGNLDLTTYTGSLTSDDQFIVEKASNGAGFVQRRTGVGGYYWGHWDTGGHVRFEQTDDAGVWEKAWMKFHRNAGMDLFYDGNIRLQTQSTGAKTVGTHEVTGLLTLNSGTYDNHIKIIRSTEDWSVTASTNGSLDIKRNAGTGTAIVDVPTLNASGNLQESGTALSAKYGQLGVSNTWSDQQFWAAEENFFSHGSAQILMDSNAAKGIGCNTGYANFVIASGIDIRTNQTVNTGDGAVKMTFNSDGSNGNLKIDIIDSNTTAGIAPTAASTFQFTTARFEAPILREGGTDLASKYAGISHNHDGTYATAGHNHDGTYATASHNHDGTYAAASHTHSYLPLSGGTVTGNLNVNAPLVIDDGGMALKLTTGGVQAAVYMGFYNTADGTRSAYIGNGSAGNNRLYILSDKENVQISAANVITLTDTTYINAYCYTDGLTVDGTTTLNGAIDGTHLTASTFDLCFGTSDQSSRGNSGASRALVKQNGYLDINYASDFGWTRISGSTKVQAIAGSATMEWNQNGYLYLSGKDAIRSADGWLRFNNTGSFTSGIYCGAAGTLRHDGSLQVGSGGSSFLANSSGVKIGGGVLFSNATGNSTRITSANGYVDVGPQNTSYCHFQTDRGAYYFNKRLYAVSGLTVYGTSTYLNDGDLTLTASEAKVHLVSNGANGRNIRILSNNTPNTGFYSVTNSAWLFRIDGSNNAFFPGNATFYYSDERLKDVHGRVENALDAVMSWEAIRYRANQLAHDLAGFDTEEDQIGLRAQDVQKTHPEVVKRAPFDIDADNGGGSISGDDYLTLQYDRLVPVLVAAIQELKAELNELKGNMK